MSNRAKVLRAGGVALSLMTFAVASVALVHVPSSATMTGPISWQFVSQPATVLAGTSDTAVVELTSTEPLRSVRFSVWPDFVSVQPPFLESFDANGTIRLSLPIAPPESRRPEKYDIRLTLKACRVTDRCAAFTKYLQFRVTVIAALPVQIPTEPAFPSPDRITDDLQVKDELLVIEDGFDGGAAALEAADTVGGRLIGGIPELGIFQLQIPGSEPAEIEALKPSIRAIDGVKEVTSHRLTMASGRMPNDSEYREWTANNYHWNLIRAPVAWDRTTGSPDVRLAVLDGGFYQHSDLENAVSGSEFDRSGREDLYIYHGTHVAGIACGQGDNARGVTGLAWDCAELLRDVSYPAVEPRKAVRWSCGEPQPRDVLVGDRLMSAYTVLGEMRRVVDAGAQIVNMSLGTTWDHEPSDGNASDLKEVHDEEAILARGVEYASHRGRNVLWVAAAGNDCLDAKWTAPASLAGAFSNVIAVGSVGASRSLSSFTNTGPLVEIAAPGEGIHSTIPARRCFVHLFCRDDYGSLGSGTSFSAPMVAGAAALVLSEHPDLTAAEVKDCLLKGPVVPNSGGIKLLDAAAAVACDKTAPPPTTEGTAIQNTPPWGRAGDSFTVLGDGFGASEPVRISFDGAHIATVQTDGTGSFQANTGVPAQASDGQHLVAAIGADSGRAAVAQFVAGLPVFEEQGILCGVLDRFGDVMTTATSHFAAFAGGELVLRCTAQGTPGDDVVLWNHKNTSLLCGLNLRGNTTDWVNRVGRDGAIQLTCYGLDDGSNTASTAEIGSR